MAIGELFQAAADLWAQRIPLEISKAGPNDSIDITAIACPEGNLPPSCSGLRDGAVVNLGRGDIPQSDQPITQLLLIPPSLDDPVSMNRLFLTILHELGHNLGLALHDVNPEAIMSIAPSPSLLNGPRPRLHSDDVRRIQEIYGARDGSVPPMLTELPTIPSDPDGTPTPIPNGPDRDDDGLSDAFEVLVSRTDPDNPDTDGDGLIDGFEWVFGLDPNDQDSDDDGRSDRDEVIAGSPAARAPLICKATDDLSTNNTAELAASVLDDLALVDGETVAVTNLRMGCRVEGVTVLRVEDSACTVRMPRALRESLCIFQLNVAVPLKFCPAFTIEILIDFEGAFLPPVTDGFGTMTQIVPRNGSQVLQANWSFVVGGGADLRFVVMQLENARSVGACHRLVVDLEVDRTQDIEVGAKTGPAGNSVRMDFQVRTLQPGQVFTIIVPITSQYALTEVDFVIQQGRNSQTPSGVFWVNNIRLETPN